MSLLSGSTQVVMFVVMGLQPKVHRLECDMVLLPRDRCPCNWRTAQGGVTSDSHAS